MLLVEPATVEKINARRTIGGDIGEVLLARLPFCSEDDRLLIEMVYRHNLSRRQIARLVKVSAGSVSRRVHRLVNRLHDPLVVALTDSTCTLPPEHRDVGIAYFLQDESIPGLMRRRLRSRREIESMIEFVRGWFRGVSGKEFANY